LFLLELRFTTLLNPSWRGVNPGQYHLDSLAWRRTNAALREIAAAAAERRVPVILLIYPTFPAGSWTTVSYPEHRLVQQVAAAGAQAGVDVVDLVPVFAAEGGDWRRWWAALHDQHPNVAAHALAARALAARIRDRGYLRERVQATSESAAARSPRRVSR
jgi:hypothetical protein